MTIPPDGGWGWVIVVVSFICNATIDGICLTYGRLIPDLTKDMNIDVSKAITISSLMNGILVKNSAPYLVANSSLNYRYVFPSWPCRKCNCK